MKIADETIIKFKNGETLRVPAEVYEKLISTNSQLLNTNGMKTELIIKFSFPLRMCSILAEQQRAHPVKSLTIKSSAEMENNYLLSLYPVH